MTDDPDRTADLIDLACDTARDRLSGGELQRRRREIVDLVRGDTSDRGDR